MQEVFCARCGQLLKHPIWVDDKPYGKKCVEHLGLPLRSKRPVPKGIQRLLKKLLKKADNYPISPKRPSKALAEQFISHWKVENFPFQKESARSVIQNARNEVTQLH
ncbi:hypothetical protein HNP93_000966 [Methanococcus maripaludis]|uniref:Uncharacterized protein n=1 Tax=Methanococcus maripaludis TaxID=39152 RepID=A0A7J9P509_METMI|nr:hypothetical protein [Methanococcus maripaludis]MBA2858265.1 hypothetical protein [Methanococcus maripaludis]